MYFEDKSKTDIIFDLEGNSASQEDQRRITQFAALVINNGKVEEISWMNRNVNYISSYVKRMTRISINRCKKEGYSEEKLIKLIYDLFNKSNNIYAYGCESDKKNLSLMFNKYHLSFDVNKIKDVMIDVKKYLAPSKAKLSVCSIEYGFESAKFHDALVDCYATYHMMKVVDEFRK